MDLRDHCTFSAPSVNNNWTARSCADRPRKDDWLGLETPEVAQILVVTPIRNVNAAEEPEVAAAVNP
jgi:hypothetical protein